MTKVFVIPFHVKPMENSIMPPGLGGAYVSCYSHGDTYIEATENALIKLKSDGLYPEEILQPIHEMESSLWADHVKDQWPDHIEHLPTQQEFNDIIASGDVVYGPFGSYNPK